MDPKTTVRTPCINNSAQMAGDYTRTNHSMQSLINLNYLIGMLTSLVNLKDLFESTSEQRQKVEVVYVQEFANKLLFEESGFQRPGKIRVGTMKPLVMSLNPRFQPANNRIPKNPSCSSRKANIVAIIHLLPHANNQGGKYRGISPKPNLRSSGFFPN